jgi:hypothetical protein
MDGMIRFSQVSALNDPFESRAVVVTTEMVGDLIAELNQGLDELVASYGSESLTEDDLALVHQTRTHTEQCTRARGAPEKLGRDVMRLMNSKLGVLSLSRTPKSLLLWSHYTEGHTGFVIGFDESDPFFSMRDGDGNYTKAHDVLYQKDRIPVPEGAAGLEAYQMLLCQKSEVWKYEEEVRIFRVLSPETKVGKDAQGYPVHLYPLSKPSIREVIFGANSSPSLRARVLQYLKLQGINARIFRARVSESTFDLHVEEIWLQPYQCGSTRDVSYTFAGCDQSLSTELYEILELRNLVHLEYEVPMPNAAAILGLRNEHIQDYTSFPL